MSTKVEVFTSPGWEAEVDTDWAEGLFAVFLRSATGHKGGPRGTTKVLGQNEQSDGVILLTVRKDGAVSVSTPPPPAETTPETPPGPDTRRGRRPRRQDEGTAKLRDSAPSGEGTGAGRGSNARRTGTRPRPIPPPPPARARAMPPPPPARTRAAAAAPAPSRPVRSSPPLSVLSRHETVRDSIPRDLRTTVPAAMQVTPLDDEGIKGFLQEMGALVKYGHAAQVRAEFDKRLPEHAEDPRFRRLMISFYFEHDMPADGIDALFGLAGLYFDRRDLPRMRECLDEILRHEPSSRRARKMRELLEKRPGRTRPPA